MIGLLQKAYMEGHEAKPMTASLFARTDMGIEDFPFDLFIDESHGLDFKISEHPLQDGAVITDHVTQQLRICKISGMFTNHSVRKNVGNTDIVSIAGYENAEAMDNVARKKYIELEELAKRREPVRLVTSLVVYPKMLIKSIKTSRNDKDGESVKFRMTLTEFNTVQLFSVSTDIVYGEGSMKDAVSRLTANVKKGGLNSATVVEVNKLLNMFGAQ